ncbi:serine hydrolase domain-containing protein [Parerythrobacter aurantius]|uniref:serine hydrolase domain-containing protein n=1 Tax=Parerythrobacter aurantius TaxID=3127706 RepID=UPI0032463DEB
MAYRDFAADQLSRRALLRGGAYLSAAGALAQVPFSRALASNAAMWPSVTATVEDYVAKGKVANMIATFGWGQQAPTVIARGTLELDGAAKADMDSLYRIYSMTKPVTGIAAMMLIDDGKLGLDQPIAEILPAFADMKVQKIYDGAITEDNLEPAVRPITVRHLLTHTAGLGYTIIQKGPIKTAMEDAGIIAGQVSRIPIPGLSRGKPVRSLEAFADGLAKLPLVRQPGTRWGYSVGLDLLGRVIEVAEGKPFADVLKDRIFDPCGMDSTWFSVPQSEIGRFTTNYGILGGIPLPMDPAASSIYLDEPPFAMGGAGLVSSPRDYDRFLAMLLGYGMIDGKRVMSEAAVRVATGNLLPATATVEGTWMAGQGFGAGGRVMDDAFGWGGAAGTAAFVKFGNGGLRAQLFTQYMPSEAYTIQNKFPELVAADLAAMAGQ